MANEYRRKAYTGGAPATKLSVAITNSDTAIQLVAVTGWPEGINPFVMTIDRETSAEEKCLCTRASGSLVCMAIERGYDNTSPVAHSVNAKVEHTIDAWSMDQTNRYVNLQAHIGDLVSHDGTNPVRILASEAGLEQNDGMVLQLDHLTDSGWNLGFPAPLSAGPTPPPSGAYGIYWNTTVDQLFVTPDGGLTWVPATQMVGIASSVSDRNSKWPTPTPGQMVAIISPTIQAITLYRGSGVWALVGVASVSSEAERDALVPTPLLGDTVFRRDEHQLTIWRNDVEDWVGISHKVTVSNSSPVNPQIGDLWFQPV